jgi:ribosomal protein L37AE/L43A
MPLIKFELKYCERCGSLRLRRADSRVTYCQSCTHLLDPTLLGASSALAGGLKSRVFQRNGQLRLPYRRQSALLPWRVQ